MVLDSTRYAIEQSARVLRGMNFWGKIVNAFTEDTKVWTTPYFVSGGSAVLEQTLVKSKLEDINLSNHAPLDPTLCQP